MEKLRSQRFRLPALLTALGCSGILASLFSPARKHGVIDVISIAAASDAYVYLVSSMVLTKPPKSLKRWLGGGKATRKAERAFFIACCVSGAIYVITIWFPIVLTLRRLDPYGPHVPTVPAAIIAAFGLGLLFLIRSNRRLKERFGKSITALTVTVFIAATIQFLTVAKLLVNLTSPHGVYLMLAACVGIVALISGMTTKRRLRVAG